MKNLEKTAKRLEKAVKNNEKIILFGDADLDGVASSIILKETIKKIGGICRVYISDRKRWDYGLSSKAILAMKREAPGVLVTLDCGISNFEGAIEAKKRGFELVIIDHHQTLSKLPKASIILNPMQKGDSYPFKKMANAGIVYKLSREILKERFKEKERRFLELASLATIADMVPREEDNKEMLKKGIPFLEKSKITALKVINKEKDKDFISNVISLLNITKSTGKTNEAYLLLTTKNEKRAREKVKKIKKDHALRKRGIEKEAEKIIKNFKDEDVLVFSTGSFSSHWGGAVASRVIKKIKKPIFLYSLDKRLASGSARVPSGDDAVKAMKHCSKYLCSFGGHSAAAGFMAKEKDLGNLEKCLREYFKKTKE